jgi:hypothetical protein
VSWPWPLTRWLGRPGCVGRSRLTALVTGVALLTTVGAAPGDDAAGRWCLVAEDRTSGAVLGEQPLPADGRFAITYRHSYYRVPATEWLTVGANGALSVERIESPSEAVLDYYELPGVAYERTRERWSTELLDPDPMPRLTVLATATGRRTLVVGDRSLPLWQAEGEARAVTIHAVAAPGCALSHRQASRGS